MLEDRARNLNRWMTATGMMLTLVLGLGIGTSFLNAFSYQTLLSSAERQVRDVVNLASAAKSLHGQIENVYEESLEIFSTMQKLQSDAANKEKAQQGDEERQERWMESLNEFGNQLRDRGFRRILRERGTRKEGGEEVWVNLEMGRAVHFAAACDAECLDLDLILYDPNGTVVERDTLADAYPLLLVRPAVEGRFRIEVGMYDCAASAATDSQDADGEAGCDWVLEAYAAGEEQGPLDELFDFLRRDVEGVAAGSAVD